MHMIDVGVCSIFACIGYFRRFYGAHYSILVIFIIVDAIDVRGFMKLVKPKKFAVFWPWRRVEEGSNGVANETREDFSAVGLVV